MIPVGLHPLVEQSNSYYHKGIATTCPYRSDMPSHNIDFKRYPIQTSHFPLTMSPKLELNSPTNLTKLIRENESDIIYLSEGLIHTVDKTLLQKRYREVCRACMPATLYNLRMHDVYAGYKENDGKRIIDYMFFTEPDIKISPLVRILFAMYSSSKDEEDVEKSTDIAKDIADKLYFAGYNFSSVSKVPDAMVNQIVPGQKILLYFVQLEAKFTDIDVKLSPYLYHATFRRYINKINQNGLVPTAKSSAFKYPERVYLFNFPSNWNHVQILSKIESYISQRLLAIHATEKDISKRYDPKIDTGFFIIKIDSTRLTSSNLFKTGKMKFYVDACYDGQVGKTTDSPAIFTYNNIPRNLIETNCVFVPIVNVTSAGAQFGSPQVTTL